MRRVLHVPAEVAFAIVADIAGHDRWIPLTTVDAPPAPLRAGDAVTGVTAGVLVDRMVVKEVRAPDGDAGLLRVRKLGPVLLGDVTITVTPLAPGRCEVDWREDVWLRGPVPRRVTAPVLRPLLDGMVALVLHRIARYLGRE